MSHDVKNPLEQDCVWGSLANTFPFRNKTSLLTYPEFIDKHKSLPFFSQQFVDLKAFRTAYQKRFVLSLSKQLLLFKENTLFEGEQFLQELYNKYLESPRHFDGCIQFYDLGDGEFCLLVVTGKHRGEVWKVNWFTKTFEPLVWDNKKVRFIDFYSQYFI